MKRYCFDIDGTICNNTWGNYDQALPFNDRIDFINSLYDEGHHITYFTARGMGVCKGDVSAVYKMWGELTEIQLSLWGCRFHELRLGKPHADFFIDDKGISDEDFYRKICP